MLTTPSDLKNFIDFPHVLNATTFLNIAYGTDTAQRMDIHLPGNHPHLSKAIILIHGGAWNSGDKSNFAYYIDTFKKRLPGYAIFNINYRLVSDKNIFPTQENDVKSAMDFIIANAEEYGIDKHELVLLGASAGAHLALLQAYKYPYPKIKTVIDFFGPTDLLAMYQKPWHPMIPYLLQTLTGATPASDISIYQQSSPAYFVTAQSAPTLILQGGSDQVVNPLQSQLLADKLERASVENELVIYPNEKHGWQGVNLSDSFDRIVNFLRLNVNA